MFLIDVCIWIYYMGIHLLGVEIYIISIPQQVSLEQGTKNKKNKTIFALKILHFDILLKSDL